MNATEEEPVFFNYVGLEENNGVVTIYEANGRLIQARKEVVKVAPSIKQVKIIGRYAEL